MSEICKKCYEALEQEVKENPVSPPPAGCCIVCWIRYGKYIQACKTLGELQNANSAK
jgi:hypothetical protein